MGRGIAALAGSDKRARARLERCLCLALVTAAACAGPGRLRWEVDELRAELARRVPGVPPEQLVVPFELEPAQAERARQLSRYLTSQAQRAEALLTALRDSDEIGLEYVPAATTTAAETLAARRGNCLSLASVVVGMARAAGLEAYYVDVSHRVEDVVRHEDLMVRSGHVLAIIRTRDGFAALDVAGRDLRVYGRWRPMTDIEATAHYYNNRGYELIYFSQERGLPVPWELAYEHFRRATLIQPDFSRAWNNLGVAAVRIGDARAAETHYRAAIARDRELPSPYANLGTLLVSRGRLAEAEPVLRRAFELEAQPEAAFRLGVVLRELGREEEAGEMLRRAARLGSDAAAELLETIGE